MVKHYKIKPITHVSASVNQQFWQKLQVQFGSSFFILVVLLHKCKNVVLPPLHLTTCDRKYCVPKKDHYNFAFCISYCIAFRFVSNNHKCKSYVKVSPTLFTLFDGERGIFVPGNFSTMAKQISIMTKQILFYF